MQTYRISNKLPQAYRIIKVVPQATPVRTMFSFPRFPSGEFAPLFRLLDDYASHQISRQGDEFGNFSQLRSFQPRFDVKEVKDGYELHGELPGVDQNDIQIEFTDAQTLSIKGRTERHRESGSPPTAALETQQEKGRITSGDESSETSSHYQKPTVEDENTDKPTATTDTEQQITTTTDTQTQQVQQQTAQRPQSRYWVSERSVGEFSRSFAFPSRVDQDNVRASLKDGILSIVVPKASAPTTRKINIE
ncbi:HSP20-like chaperone [Aureobasidium sp. EXF-10727]|nr:HSP20-like chaperone [Aureobasidium sp. EXF-10727]KAI4728842.1 HSP20-like chaperone [Aureobasidium sp. EXF-10728]